MRVLALETSTDRLSLAVSHGSGRCARDLVVGHRHAETLFGETRALLQEAGLDLTDLDAIAFGAGPGAFTGLRIASGVAQGLAESLGVPVVGVSCLEAIAHASGAPRALVCIDARMGEVYHAAYRRGDDDAMIEALPPSVVPPHAAPIPEGSGWTGLGGGFAAYGQTLLPRYATLLVGVDDAAVPTASAMLDIALRRLASGERGDPAQAVPVYLRERVALTVAERRERAA